MEEATVLREYLGADQVGEGYPHVEKTGRGYTYTQVMVFLHSVVRDSDGGSHTPSRKQAEQRTIYILVR